MCAGVAETVDLQPGASDPVTGADRSCPARTSGSRCRADPARTSGRAPSRGVVSDKPERLSLGRQGQRATSEVATRYDRARPGRPYGHGLSTADEVGAHRYGVVQDRSSRARLCWHATRTPSSSLRGMRLARHRQRPHLPARLHGRFGSRRWVLTSRRSSRLDAAASSAPTPRRARFLICQEPGSPVVTGEDLLVDRLVASQVRLGREALLDPGPQGCVLGPLYASIACLLNCNYA
jgi:hypothetical protein